MMYKVYKKTKLNYHKECEKCHSLFSFDDNELIHTYKGSNISDEILEVECPVCGYFMSVSKSDIAGISKDPETLSEIFANLNDIVSRFFNKSEEEEQGND